MLMIILLKGKIYFPSMFSLALPFLTASLMLISRIKRQKESIAKPEGKNNILPFMVFHSPVCPIKV